jgi:hypothetical protein
MYDLLRVMLITLLSACEVVSGLDNLHVGDAAVDASMDVSIDGSHSSYYQAVMTDLPRGYWRLGEVAETVPTADEINLHPGQYSGVMTLGVPGALTADPNTAVQFAGGWADMMTVSVMGTTFSLEAWISCSQTNITRGIAGRYAVGAASGFALLLNSNGTAVYAVMGNQASSTARVDDGKWHHLVGVYTPLMLSLYVDGTLVSMAPASAFTPTAYAFRVGADSSTPTPRTFAGTIDEVALYPQALSAARVAAHFAAASIP